jgi:hypothetical protein
MPNKANQKRFAYKEVKCLYLLLRTLNPINYFLKQWTKWSKRGANPLQLGSHVI